MALHTAKRSNEARTFILKLSQQMTPKEDVCYYAEIIRKEISD
jgi:hypothetical protein